MKKTNQLEKKLKKLNMSGDRSGAILLIRKYLEKNPPADTLMLQLAFFLYHDATQRLNQNNKALWWYKNTEKISDKKNKDELILAKQGLSNFYKKIGENGKAEVYKNQTLKLILGDSLESKSMRKILKNK